METRPTAQKEEGVHSEYGGLVLSADSALGLLGVHEPRGATLGLRICFLFHKVPLEKKKSRRHHQFNSTGESGELSELTIMLQLDFLTLPV